MRYGYARVSTTDQNPTLQLDALKVAGCGKIFTDHGVSGTLTKRPQLDRCLKALGEGDTLVVWKLDRLGRSLTHLIATVDALRARGVGFASLSEAMDTTTPQGKLLFHMMGALAEFERTLIVERTAAGRAAAMKRGVHFGPKRKLTHQQLQHARALLDHPDEDERKSVPEIADLLGVHRVTLYRNLNRASAQ
jgi:DNA invertase Pin-like site-specific DNA recombinase